MKVNRCYIFLTICILIRGADSDIKILTSAHNDMILWDHIMESSLIWKKLFDTTVLFQLPFFIVAANSSFFKEEPWCNACPDAESNACSDAEGFCSGKSPLKIRTTAPLYF